MTPRSNACWDAGTDIGGTFTDIVAIDTTSGETRTAKVPSRPNAPVDAMLEALAAIQVPPEKLRRFVHGTTRVTNAIVQDRLPPIALIATAGFEDVLEIGRYRRLDLYDLDIPPKSPPLVPHTHCFGLQERIDHEGTILTPLTAEELNRLTTWLSRTNVQSVAICLLHAYANPCHEQQVAAALQGTIRHISLSHQINPEAREYERASSTAYNAAAMPVAADYLAELERRIPLGAGLQVFHSAGGMIPIATARQRPIAMAMSGPAAGVAASVSIARALALDRVLTFDMGGTTTDVCLIVDGAAEMTDTRMTAGRPLRQPMLAVQSIGAGGGSIVRLGPGGLTVGPHSAGVEPGPACYARGGTEPTITDANAILGYLDPDANLGGSIHIDVALAEAAIQPIATALNLSLIETALGIVQVANATMARALRRVTVERGIDGRDCTLLAFGGGGPMHATGLADLYGLSRIVVPAASSAFSALGCLTADLSFTHQQTIRLPLANLSRDPFQTQLTSLIAQATAPLLATGVLLSSIQLTYTALMRYEAQSDTTPIPFTLPLNPAALHAAFQTHHQTLYGYSTAEPCIIESLRVEARHPTPPLLRAGEGRGGGVPCSATTRTRPCSFPGVRNTPTVVISRETLVAPTRGPAIIADAWSTVILPPCWQATPTPDGHLILLPVLLGEGRGEGPTLTAL